MRSTRTCQAWRCPFGRPWPCRCGETMGDRSAWSRSIAARAKNGFAAADLDLLAALAVPVGVAVENHRLLREQASWAAAGEIQRFLLPRRQPDHPRLHVLGMLPAGGGGRWRPLRLYSGRIVGNRRAKGSAMGGHSRRRGRQGDAGRTDDGRDLSGSPPPGSRGGRSPRGPDAGQPQRLRQRDRMPVRDSRVRGDRSPIPHA